MNERSCRAAVSTRSGGLCEVRIAGACYGRAASKHHRRKQSQGGLWVASNVLDVCGSGTTGCHGWVEANPEAAHDLRLWLFTGELPASTPLFAYWSGRPGWWLFADDGSVAPAVMQRCP